MMQARLHSLQEAWEAKKLAAKERAKENLAAAAMPKRMQEAAEVGCSLCAGRPEWQQLLAPRAPADGHMGRTL